MPPISKRERPICDLVHSSALRSKIQPLARKCSGRRNSPSIILFPNFNNMFITENMHRLLTSTANLPANIRVWADIDPTQENLSDKFPMITHIDEYSEPHTHELGLWRHSYHIAVWCATKLEAMNYARIIREKLDRYSDTELLAVSIKRMSHSFDQTTQTNGIHLYFSIVTRE